MTEANSNPTEVDTIYFDIPAASDSGCDAASGVCEISPASGLPEVTEAVTTDGYSQAGASPNTLSTGSDADLKIVLSGQSAGGTPGIQIASSDRVIRGPVVNRWSQDGVRVLGPSAGGNRIEGNFIGTDAFGTADLGNGASDVVIYAAPGNAVGGTTTAAANTIAHNSGDGVLVDEGSNPIATNNAVLGNSVYENGKLGINLEGGTQDASGVTANDAKNPDTGPNNLQNYPAITSAVTVSGQSSNSRQYTERSQPDGRHEAFALDRTSPAFGCNSL